MRLCKIQYLIRRAEFHELFKDPADTPVLYACCELAVRKSACSALAELNIALGIKNSLLLESADCFNAAVNVRSPLKDYRAGSCHCKNKRRKHSCRPESDNDRSFGNSAYFWDIIRILSDCGEILMLSEKLFLAAHVHVNCDNKVYIGFFSCVNRFFRENRALYLTERNAEFFGAEFSQP